ncbi:MAG: hypothetical protein IJR00_09025 [Lachnospiraceae bacterium]|nr:hypothetical protein [Lachnospiraceae bacterium]
MEEDRRRRFPVFFLLFLLLVIGGGIFGILRIRQYVTHRMEVLEQSNPDPVAEALAAKLVSGDFQGLPVTIANGEEIAGETPFRELSRVAQFVRDKCSGKTTSVTAVAETETERTYRIDAGAEPVLFLTLAEKKNALEYGYSSWEGKGIHIPAEDLIPKTLYFRVPSGTVITLDGEVMGEAYRKEEEEHIPLLAQLTALEIVSPPTFLSYEIEGIFLDPQVRMTDAEEREIPFEEEEYRYTAGFTAPEGFAEEQEAWILSMIEPWGRYLTEDGGLGPAVARVRAGSPAYHTISKATVHWTAGHGGTSFADKSVDNFKVYSALCFSCDVHYKQTVHFREGRLWDTHMTWVFVRKDESAPWLLADVRMWYPDTEM